MCGIIYAHNLKQKPVNNWVLDQFDSQRNRGTQGFGVYDGQHIVRATTEDKILKWLCLKDSDLLMFHHRFPTSTENVKKAAHPFTTRDYFGDTEYILIHNGIIRNPNDRRTAHTELGIEYHSMVDEHKFNDSEALLWDFALTMEGKGTMDDIHGDMAFICVRTIKGKPDRLYFARQGRPLNLYRDKETITLSSQGKGEEIPEHELYTYNYELNRLTHKRLYLHRWKPIPESEWQSTTSYTDSNYISEEDDWEDRWGNEWRTREIDVHEPGGWLPAKVRERIKNFLPAGNRQTVLTMEEIEENYESYLPYSNDVIDTLNGYLITAKGHFEQALWAIEMDYDDIQDQPDTEANIKEQILLEKVLEMLEADPEYKDSESVSTLWGGTHAER